VVLCSFISVCAACRDDPASAVPECANDGNQDVIAGADDFPAFLAGAGRRCFDDRFVEDPDGVHKVDSVFLEIAQALGFVPFEWDIRTTPHGGGLPAGRRLKV